MKEVVGKLNFLDSCKKFVDILNDSIVFRVVIVLKFEVKVKCLVRKVKKWYDEI